MLCWDIKKSLKYICKIAENDEASAPAKCKFSAKADKNILKQFPVPYFINPLCCSLCY